MATTVAVLQALLTANTRDFDRALARSDTKMKGLGRTALRLGTIVGGTAGLGALVRAGFNEFNQAQKVTAQTEAVLKSTGGVANVTGKQVDKLAEALMKKSGVDDEVIKSGENMLLTFTGIRNEVGRGNDIFDQATKATLDLSVAMGKDMQSSAILVGKALNDPIKGMTSLTRAGIQFTDEQKNTIKALVESGDKMGAQKIILEELQTQFGGSAEAAGKTFSGQINIAKETVNNFLGTIVEKAIPALTSMFNYIREHWPQVRTIAQNTFGWIRENIFPVIREMRDIFVQSVGRMREVIDNNGPEIRRILKTIGEVMTEIWKVAGPALRVFFVEILPPALSIAIKVIDKVFSALSAVEGALKGLRSWVKENGAKMLDPIVDAFETAARWIGKVVDGVKWLIDHIPKIPKLPGWVPGGDAKDPDFVPPGMRGPLGGGDLHGASEVMRPFANLGSMYGLHVTSGKDDHGMYTSSGKISDHWYGKALDLADGPASMAGFFKALIGNRRVKQAFYDPLGSIFGGALSSYREGGHSDHVHVATYDQGGYLRPGWNLAYNGLGRPEPVGAGSVTFNFPNYVGSKTELMGWLQNAAQEFKRRNGRSAF